MTTNECSPVDVGKEVDCLIKKHLVEKAETADDGLPVAAVSASDRFSWAKQAGVQIDFVDQRLATICHEIPASEEKHWAVPRFRMKKEEQT